MKNGIMKGHLYYTSIQEPKFKFESEEKEWSVTIAVDQATSKSISQEMPKVKPKMVSNDDFEGIYKTDVPYPEQPIQYLYTIKRSVLKANGEATSEDHRPRVYLEDKSGNIYDITEKYKVGNGSVGEVHYFVKETKYGEFPGLANVRVTQLVEFQSTSNGTNLREAAKALPEDVDLASIANVVKETGEVATETKASPSTDISDNGPVKDDNAPF